MKSFTSHHLRQRIPALVMIMVTLTIRCISSVLYVFILIPDDHRSSCPPPISAQQIQQNVLPSSSYTSLKRTHSNISNSSANSSERKTDSPSITSRFSTVVEPQKSLSRVSIFSAEPLAI